LLSFNQLPVIIVSNYYPDVIDVFIHNRLIHYTDLLSPSTDGVPGNNNSFNPFVSANWLYVAFDLIASNLVSNDTNNENDIFVHDLFPDIEYMYMLIQKKAPSGLGYSNKKRKNDAC